MVGYAASRSGDAEATSSAVSPAQIGAKASGEAWDTFGVTSKNMPDPLGIVRLTGAADATEKLALRKDSETFTASFFVGQEVAIRGTSLEVKFFDKDLKNNDLIADTAFPLAELMGEAHLMTPDGQLALRVTCL